MRTQYATTIDINVHQAIKEIKRQRGITGEGVLRAGIKAITGGEQAKILELEEINEKLRGKLQAHVMRVYALEARVKEIEAGQDRQPRQTEG